MPVQCCDSIMVYVWLRFLEVEAEGVRASLAQRLEPSSIRLGSECDGPHRSHGNDRDYEKAYQVQIEGLAAF